MRADLLHAVRLARMDLKLLGRNQTALFNVMLLPLLMAVMIAGLAPDGATGAVSARLFVLTGLPGLLLGFAVFVNLVNTFTARREELVLKRLRAGQVSQLGILGGSALAALALYLAQVALLVLWITRVQDGPPPANLPLLLLAALLGTVVFALLAAALAGITRTAELAQITVLPVLMIVLFGAPLYAPVPLMPEPLRLPAELIPMTPVVEIMRTAFLGGDFVAGVGEPLTIGEQWVAALPSFGVLLAWLLVAGLLARWLFRWDPRRV